MDSPKFLADENVAKLGKRLRILGYDVAYQSPATDAQLALKALRENRVILTRDRGFPRRRMVEKRLLLASQDPVEQLKQVIQTFGLRLNPERFFTRCLDCNSVIEQVSREAVKAVVPDYVYRTQNQFHQCVKRQKLYWRGSHTKNFQNWLRRIKGEEK
jgi:hypothetical protein